MATSDIGALDDTPKAVSALKSQIDKYIIAALDEWGIHDMVPSHGDIIVSLIAQDGLAMRELAARISRDPSTVTALVGKLERGGYVRTETDETDKRARRVWLTKRGRALKGAFIEISVEMEARLFSGFSAKERRIFKQLLRTAESNMAME